MPQASMEPTSGRQTTSPELSLDQLLAAIRGLDETGRSEVARILAGTEMDTRCERLIRRLAEKAPVDGISDAEIQAEVNAVRRAHVRGIRGPGMVSRSTC